MTKFILNLCFLFIYGITLAQVQIGSNIIGEANTNHSGTSISMPDLNTLAIGAHNNDGNGNYSGHVRIYKMIGSTWVQKGTDIDGEAAGDRSGISVSMPDSNTVAIGAYKNTGMGTEAGHVRVYKWNGSAWVQKGSDIDAEAFYNYAGYSVSMPDSNTLAMGAPNNDDIGTNAGHVRIFSWNGSAWIQKGADIDGEAAYDNFGWSVSMPDSNTLAVGAPLNGGGGFYAGHVRIYTWNGNAWVQKGTDIDGEASSNKSGYSVHMPDTNTVAIGATDNSGNGGYSGHVRIYTWSGSAWIQKGVDIDGEAIGDKSGFSVHMPDTNTVAIGAPENSANGTNAGHVRVYSWDGSAWVQKGTDIDGALGWYRAGTSVCMPDSLILAFGTPGYGLDYGLVQVYWVCATSSTISATACESYTLPSGDETLTTSGTYLDTIPNAEGCDSFMTIDLTILDTTSSTISATACDNYTVPSGDETYTTSGTYTDTIPNAVGCDSFITINLTIKNSTNTTISDTACDNYTVPSGDETYTTSGIYKDTIPNAGGCDSIMTINLTINNTSSAPMSEKACGSYTVPSGDETYTTSGIYKDTIPNAVGCDSIMTINLTINNVSSATLLENACGSYTVPSGDETYTISGTYLDTIPNAEGCDSFMTINLTIQDSTSSTISATACDNYTVPSGDETYTTSGTYTDTIPNAGGCDSFMTINLTINNSTNSIISEIACDNYTVPSGDEIYTTSGTYKDTIPNAGGCDSIMTINLTINNATSATVSATACGSYAVPSGDEIYTTSGTYLDTIPNAASCDSLITINLTINEADTSLTVDDSVLTANASGASYQWLDCNKNFSPIPGATFKSYIATVSGNYAVEVVQNSCRDTSACVNVTLSSIKYYTQANGDLKLHIYPNPTNNLITIELDNTIDLAFTLKDISGKEIENGVLAASHNTIDLSSQPAGIYILDISRNGLVLSSNKVIKK